MHSRIPYASTQSLCFMWLFLSLAIIGVYLSSYASDSCIAFVFIVVFLQDGDFNLMIVARYLHRYNDDARPGTSMEAFLLFLSYELLYFFFFFVSYVSQCVCVCVCVFPMILYLSCQSSTKCGILT